MGSLKVNSTPDPQSGSFNSIETGTGGSGSLTFFNFVGPLYPIFSAFLPF